jgi:hypothetical protein
MFNLGQGIGYSGVSSPEYHVSRCLARHGIRATYSDSISRHQTEQQKNAEVMSRVYPGDWVRIRLRSALLLANKPSRSPRHARGVAIDSGGAGTQSPVVPLSRPLALLLSPHGFSSICDSILPAPHGNFSAGIEFGTYRRPAHQKHVME